MTVGPYVYRQAIPREKGDSGSATGSAHERRRFAAIVALAIGMPGLALMLGFESHATPLACPVPDGTVIGGTETIDTPGVCVIGATDILSTGRLDIDRANPAATGGRLNNAGALNVNDNLLLSGNTLDNAVGGVVNNSGETTVFSGLREAFLVNRGALNNLSGGTIDNFGTLNNEATGTIENFGTLNTGGETRDLPSNLVNRGILNNAGTLNQSASLGGSRVDNFGTLNNNGEISFLFDSGAFANQSGGQFLNSGTVGGGELTNSGALNNQAGGVLDVIGLNSGVTDPAATVTNRTGGTIVGRGASRLGSLLTNEAGGETQFSSLLIRDAGVLDNAGTFDPLGSGILSSDGAIVNRAGGVFNARFSALLLNGAATLDNQAGALFDASGANGVGPILTQAGTRIDNAGEFRIGAGISLRASGTDQTQSADFRQTDGSTVVDGEIALNTVDFQGGSVSGSGSIGAATGPAVFAGTTIDPGNSPGTLAIDGDEFRCLGCVINIEVAGLGVGQFDLLDVAGEARFVPVLGAPDPLIAISFIDGFVPRAGDSFNFLTAGNGISGFELIDFSIAGFPADLDFDISLTPDQSAINFVAFQTIDSSIGAGDKRSRTVSVPEPASAGLLGLGLAALGWLRRQRKFKRTREIASFGKRVTLSPGLPSSGPVEPTALLVLGRGMAHLRRIPAVRILAAFLVFAAYIGAGPAQAAVIGHNGAADIADADAIAGSGAVNIGLLELNPVSTEECDLDGLTPDICLAKLYLPGSANQVHEMTIDETSGAFLFFELVANLTPHAWAAYHFRIENATLTDGFAGLLDSVSGNLTPFDDADIMFELTPSLFELTLALDQPSAFGSDSFLALGFEFAAFDSEAPIRISQSATVAVPEPGTMAFFALAFAGLILVRKGRRAG